MKRTLPCSLPIVHVSQYYHTREWYSINFNVMLHVTTCIKFRSYPTPSAPSHMSLIQRCPYFRGVLEGFHCIAYLRHSKVFLIQGCPLRGVPLYCIFGTQQSSLIYSLVPRLSAQLFFARSKITTYFTTCKKKLGRKPGNEATLIQMCPYFRNVP